MQLIDGKEISAQIKTEIAKEIAALIDSDQNTPHLAAILVGEDPASQTYVASKERACKAVGMTSSIYRLPAETTEEELLKTIGFLNNDPDVSGFIVQLPLPKHINVDTVIGAIDPAKDVDGFHPMNVGRMALGQAAYLPATPYGIMNLLERSGIATQGKNVVVVGRSNIVGTPMSILLSRKGKNADATVTLCHSRTQNLNEICAGADILIAAIGIPEFIKKEMVKEGAVVIDVGIHRVDADTPKGYKIVGDVDFENVSEKCSAITPVPGGVGPMTIVSLIQNTLKAFKKEIYK
ncbi:MAG: bifunctional methylenetetrahydrofolate dehydrogenase/methenyltetrahydrofolate cyclohydrolase FolD [Bacteroidales bacterium]|nr:bifunctional methylenetetrahydrofolate dehydrogenase/methenyltetrahydrofolate cyclohydrolase FolD [Bacteroidales bacterium]